MGVTKTNTGRIVCSNAAYLHITPWLNEDTIGEETYDIIDIVGDTLSFTPDDNTVNSKEAEFKDDPLFENITLGDKTSVRWNLHRLPECSNEGYIWLGD